MRAFVLTRLAERDLDQIKIFLIDRAGPKIARRILKDLRRALELLGKKPGLGHVREDLTNRPVKFWRVYSYLVIYDPETKPVQITASCMGCETWRKF